METVSCTILAIGDGQEGSTFSHRLRALERLGHRIVRFDPVEAVGLKNRFSQLFNIFHYKTGYLLFQPLVERALSDFFARNAQVFDLAWINSGEWVGPAALKRIKSRALKTVLCNNDDPTGGRDHTRFASLLRALPYYDLTVVVREVNVSEYFKQGAKRVFRIYMSYDEVEHRMPDSDEQQAVAALDSDIGFIGTWMPERGPFIKQLMDSGLKLSLLGNRWEKAPEWPTLQKAWRGTGVTDRRYALNLAATKINLGLLSKGNRDLHTRRSMEVPAVGGLLCGERTSEHQALYLEGSEAVFWSNPEECIQVCQDLLADDQKREKIRQAGARRVRSLGVGNEDVCRAIVEATLDPAQPAVSSMKLPLHL